MTTANPRSPDELKPSRAWKSDVVSGFLVFLIALPLCLGISMASGFPPFAGALTAIVGGVVATLLGGAPLTIKGPAAGLIVIVLGAVEELGKGDSVRGYQLVLGVVVVSGVIQALLGLLRAGKLGDAFPSAAVHGMLASIGIIIVTKQVHFVFGVIPTAKNAFSLFAQLPHTIATANPAIALIGVTSLCILFGWPLLSARWAKAVPGPMIVLVVSMILGSLLDLEHLHRVHAPGFSDFEVGPSYLISVPERLSRIVAFPDFSGFRELGIWKHVLLFTIIGSLESLLSAKAIDSLDPWRRKSNLDRDLFATGIGNALAGLIGGLPMISEIVRSSANVNNGGRTRFANFFHSAFLLSFIALAPSLVHRIPLAALAAMLVYTGARLASPREFAKTLAIGKEQLAIFVTTIVATLLTDLLLGMAVGVSLKLAFHLSRGLELRDLFTPGLAVEDSGDVVHVRIERAAVFTNYLAIKKALAKISLDRQVVLDFSSAVLVDHTVMEHLHTEEGDRARAGGKLTIRGLDEHHSMSSHPRAARIRIPNAARS
ncbi:MAG: SulP family inorganic anion transporter [Byssovorax sp.]